MNTQKLNVTQEDWDFLIILSKRLPPQKARSLQIEVYRRLHNVFPYISIDIWIKDKLTFDEEKIIANTLANEAFLEGIKA